MIHKGKEPSSERCPHGFITIINIIHTVYNNYNNIVLIKNYYVNSYLTTCMAQSIYASLMQQQQ